MVIKYKAKYIRDGEVVIDDNALIELGSEATQGNTASNTSRSKSHNAWERLIAESGHRSKGVEQDSDPDNDADIDPDNEPAPPEK